MEEPSALRWLFFFFHLVKSGGEQLKQSESWRLLLGLRLLLRCLLLLRFGCSMRRSWQLQHGRALTFAQPGDQHDLPVGKLQRVMVNVGVVHADLSESGYLLLDPSKPQAWPEPAKGMVTFHLFLERQLRART